jgi:hypothetical protein
VEESDHALFVSFCARILRGKTEEAMKNLSEDGRPPNREYKPGTS